MSYTNMKCPECGKERTMLPEWKACGYCDPKGKELPDDFHSRRTSKQQKLTEEQVREIRTSDKSLFALASRFGVSPMAIWKAKNAKSYKWIKPRVHDQYPEELPIGREGAGM